MAYVYLCKWNDTKPTPAEQGRQWDPVWIVFLLTPYSKMLWVFNVNVIYSLLFNISKHSIQIKIPLKVAHSCNSVFR